MNNDINAKEKQAPEGMEQSPRGNDAANVSFTDAPAQTDGQPTGDSLPLDGSLSMNDTQPLDQTGLHSDEDRVLVGSEGGQTAGAAIQAGDATDQAVDSKGAYDAAPDTTTDGSKDVNADPDLTDALDYVKSAEGGKPGQTATGGQ